MQIAHPETLGAKGDQEDLCGPGNCCRPGMGRRYRHNVFSGRYSPDRGGKGLVDRLFSLLCVQGVCIETGQGTGAQPNRHNQRGLVMADETKSEVRRRALLHVVASGFATAVLVALLLFWREAGGNPRRALVIATAVPFAWFLVQMAASLTGVPFLTMAKTWDSLGGAQKLVLGLAILAIAFVIFAGIGITVVMSLTTT